MSTNLVRDAEGGGGIALSFDDEDFWFVIPLGLPEEPVQEGNPV